MNADDTGAAAELAEALKMTADAHTATALIKALALKVIEAHTNDSHGFIAERLNQLGVPTISGRGKWNRSTVFRLATAAGIKVRFTPQACRVAV